MVKLKIGTGTSKKKQKPKQEKEDDYFSELSDNEIEAIQVEAFSEEEIEVSDLKVLKDSIDTEVKESVQTALSTIKVEDEQEEEVKEAVNGVFILDEVGIGIRYAEKYASLFPKKKVVYRGLFTKAFLKWYITNVKVSKLKDLYIVESEYVKTEQKDEIMKWITKRLKANKDTKPEEECSDIIDLGLETQDNIDMYEFLLSEKWDEDKRAKGITQLDAILEEQMRIDINMTDALKYLIDAFHLQTKWYNSTKTKKDEDDEITNRNIQTEGEFIEEHEDRHGIFFSGEPNKGSNAEKIREIDRSIKRFHHIKFLYELMGSGKMELLEGLTDEEFKHIQQIDDLLNNTTIIEGKELPAKKSKKTTESMDKFFEGD